MRCSRGPDGDSEAADPAELYARLGSAGVDPSRPTDAAGTLRSLLAAIEREVRSEREPLAREND